MNDSAMRKRKLSSSSANTAPIPHILPANSPSPLQEMHRQRSFDIGSSGRIDRTAAETSSESELEEFVESLAEIETDAHSPVTLRTDGEEYRRDSANSFGSLEEHQNLIEVDDQQLPTVKQNNLNLKQTTANMLRHFIDELENDDLAGNAKSKFAVQRERVSNFFTVPLEIEKFMGFGYLVCMDAFLWLFTVLPLRCIRSFWHIIRQKRLSTAQKCDLMRAAMLAMCCYFFMYMDASRLYHSIRGQAIIKLYVIFNVLEIGDRLCCSFGQDILDSLFSKYALSQTNSNDSPTTASAPSGSIAHLNPILHFLLASAYVIVHTLLMLYQVITLNVAINSHNNSLFTLLVSNQFVEIKGSVFKKFEKENLFQVSCSDIVERFNLSIYLLIISLRNFLEMAGEAELVMGGDFVSPIYEFFTRIYEYFYLLAHSDSLYSALSNILSSLLVFLIYTIPNSIYDTLLHPFTFKLDFDTYLTLIEVIFVPALSVFLTEVFVDWLKHAFITKFNQIRPHVYSKFLDVLCKDFHSANSEGKRSSAAVAGRLGFASMPLSCLSICIFLQNISTISWLYCSKSSDELMELSLTGRITCYVKPVIGWISLFSLLFILKLSASEWVHRIACSRPLVHSETPMKRQVSSITTPSAADSLHPKSRINQMKSFSIPNSPRYISQSTGQINTKSGSLSPAESSVSNLRARQESRQSQDSFLIDGTHNRLQREDEDHIGDIKIPHPEGKISLENIDRYTLFKSRIP